MTERPALEELREIAKECNRVRHPFQNINPMWKGLLLSTELNRLADAIEKERDELSEREADFRRKYITADNENFGLKYAMTRAARFALRASYDSWLSGRLMLEDCARCDAIKEVTPDYDPREAAKDPFRVQAHDLVTMNVGVHTCYRPPDDAVRWAAKAEADAIDAFVKMWQDASEEAVKERDELRAALIAHDAIGRNACWEHGEATIDDCERCDEATEATQRGHEWRKRYGYLIPHEFYAGLDWLKGYDPNVCSGCYRTADAHLLPGTPAKDEEIERLTKPPSHDHAYAASCPKCMAEREKANGRARRAGDAIMVAERAIDEALREHLSADAQARDCRSIEAILTSAQARIAATKGLK